MRSALRVAGEACLTVGVVVGLFAAYLMWGTGPRAAQEQDQFATQLNQAWRASPGSASASPNPAVPDPITVVTGEPFAFMRIPAFGAQWRFTIIQGTQLA